MEAEVQAPSARSEIRFINGLDDSRRTPGTTLGARIDNTYLIRAD